MSHICMHTDVLKLTSAGCSFAFSFMRCKMKWNKIDWHFDIFYVSFTPHTLKNYKLQVYFMNACHEYDPNPWKRMLWKRNNTQKQDPNMTMTDKHLTYCQKPYKSKWNAESVKYFAEKWHDTLACCYSPMC